jgi:hypothetical protein
MIQPSAGLPLAPAAESAAIQKELALVEPDVQKKLVELRRAGYFVY